jgi:hypothetical protein
VGSREGHLQVGDDRSAIRALPVPFCGRSFLPEYETSERPLTACVPYYHDFSSDYTLHPDDLPVSWSIYTKLRIDAGYLSVMVH